MSLVDEVVEAHGGLDRWRQASAVRLRLSSGGPAFATKGQRTTLHDLTATVATRGQAVTLEASTWGFQFDSRTPGPRVCAGRSKTLAMLARRPTWCVEGRTKCWRPDLDTSSASDLACTPFSPPLTSLRERAPGRLRSVG